MGDIYGKRTFSLLCIAALAHCFFTLAVALTRLYSFKASLLDSGAFDQVLWSFLHTGSPLSTVNSPFIGHNWFGFHFSPVLLLLTPFYALWPHAELLQLVQSLCFAFAGIPLFYAVRALGLGKTEALACALLYWTNPLVISASVWDFHEIAFSAPLIALALWALAARQFTTMVITLALLVLTKEQYGVSVAGFGFLWGWHHGDWKRGSLLMLGGLLCTAVIFGVIMPGLYGKAHPMFGGEASHLNRYGWLSAPWDIRISLFAKLMFGDGTRNVTGLEHLIMLALSGIFFVALAPLYLAPAAGDLLANLLSANPMPRHPAAYHGAACIPVVLFAAARAFTWLEQAMPSSKKFLRITAVLLATAFPVSGLTWYALSVWEIDRPVLNADTRHIDAITALVGSGSAVSAQPNIGMFFSQRAAIYPFPQMIAKSDTVILHLYQPFSDPDELHFGIPFRISSREYVRAVSDFMDLSNWHIAYWQSPWLVMQRGKAERDETGDREAINTALSSVLQGKKQ